jgi:hypothetical protein
MSMMHEETLERTDADDADLTRRRGDRRRAENRPPEIGERRAAERRKPPGLLGLISAVFGRN